MGMSGSEIAALIGVAVLLNGLGVLAWRRGLVGGWFLWVLGLALLAVPVDPMQFPGVGAAACLVALTLALVGPVALLRHRANRKPLPAR